MKVYVVIKRAANAAEDVIECLGVFGKIKDARKTMLEDFKRQEYEESDCEEFEVEEDRIYIVGGLGFSYDHYWIEIVGSEAIGCCRYY